MFAQLTRLYAFQLETAAVLRPFCMPGDQWRDPKLLQILQASGFHGWFKLHVSNMISILRSQNSGCPVPAGSIGMNPDLICDFHWFPLPAADALMSLLRVPCPPGVPCQWAAMGRRSQQNSVLPLGKLVRIESIVLFWNGQLQSLQALQVFEHPKQTLYLAGEFPGIATRCLSRQLL